MLGAILAKREVAKGYEAIGRHDLDTLMAMFHDDAVFEFPTGTVLGGSFRGHEEIREWFERWFDAMPQISFTLRHVSVENIFAMGPTNVLHVEWDLDETDTAGRRYHLTGVGAFEIEGGKARRVKDYIFDQGVVEQVWPSREVAGS
jgi:ketosteroid isomerase-like protein